MYKDLKDVLPEGETLHMGGDEVSGRFSISICTLFFKPLFHNRFSLDAGIQQMKWLKC